MDQNKLPDDWREVVRSNSTIGIVYILALENGRFYVGHTRNFPRRMEAHFTGRGSYWTKRYRPVRCLWVTVGSSTVENEVTSRTIERFGLENVRGGQWAFLERDYFLAP